jgi:predicted O-methyltransferase YrrM
MKAKVLLILFRLAPILDLLFVPLSVLSSIWSYYVRSAGFERMSLARRIYLMIGVLPIRRHYYEPFIELSAFRSFEDRDRNLPGIDMLENHQLELLKKLVYQDELIGFPVEKVDSKTFNYGNEFFGPGDAEILYAMLRHYKPRRIIEIGSGNSTLMMLNALAANRVDNPDYECDLICVEPYESLWLEELGISVHRNKVEEIDLPFFSRLEENDILFIDSSHVIKPYGDILYLYLQVLPLLKSGVLVHIHDILTPRDYFKQWVVDKLQLWNEQYILEAFLSMNRDYQIVAALNFLKHHHFDALAAVCPIMAQMPSKEPGSFWIRRL